LNSSGFGGPGMNPNAALNFTSSAMRNLGSTQTGSDVERMRALMSLMPNRLGAGPGPSGTSSSYANLSRLFGSNPTSGNAGGSASALPWSNRSSYSGTLKDASGRPIQVQRDALGNIVNQRPASGGFGGAITGSGAAGAGGWAAPPGQIPAGPAIGSYTPPSFTPPGQPLAAITQGGVQPFDWDAYAQLIASLGTAGGFTGA
jgi:hypothetical protein